MTPRWLKKATLYKQFNPHPEIEKDYSKQAAQEMFDYESKGIGDLSLMIFDDGKRKVNGYAYGKHWMDWQINAWRDGIAKGYSSKFELWADLRNEFPFKFLKYALDLHSTEDDLLNSLGYRIMLLYGLTYRQEYIDACKSFGISLN